MPNVTGYFDGGYPSSPRRASSQPRVCIVGYAALIGEPFVRNPAAGPAGPAEGIEEKKKWLFLHQDALLTSRRDEENVVRISASGPQKLPRRQMDRGPPCT